ncbi:MAG: hypothetical protein PVS2B2_12760 [Candidatus Acidiferrum sp.]
MGITEVPIRMMQSSPLNFRRVVLWIGRIALAGIFIYAGYAKLYVPTMTPRPPIKTALLFFAFQVDSYHMLPPAAVQFVAHTLPFVEIAIGLLLLFGWQLRIWMTLISLLMTGFFFTVLRAYLLHLEINCGCFATPEPLTIKTVIRDGILLLLTLAITTFAFQEAQAPHPWTAPEKS